MPSDILLLSKSKSFYYVHHSGSTSDLDFVLSNTLGLQSVVVDVSDDMLTSDHLNLKLCMNLFIPQISQQAQWFLRMHWDNINILLCQSVLDSMLSKIKIPFHLLSTTLNSSSLDLDCYLTENTHSIKVAASAVVPFKRIRAGTRKRAGAMTQSYSLQRTVTRFGLRSRWAVIVPDLF